MKNLPFARIALPEQIAEMIRSDLESKRWSEFLPGERTLSELLQVSRTSLRSALDILEKQGLVRTAHGRRRQIVTPHGTRQPQGKRLASIAMVCPVPVERMEPFVLLEIEHIRELLGRRNCVLHIIVRPSCYTRRPHRALDLLVNQTESDLWLLWRSTAQMQRWFFGRKLKHVLVGSAFCPNQSPSVDIAHFATARHAFATFARLGHQRIAIIIDESPTAGNLASINGFLEGETEPPPVQADVLKHDGSPEGIRKSVNRLFAMQPRPTAIFSAGGVQTVAIITHVREQGFRIPAEMSIISRDDDPILDYVIPAPARYRREPAKFARAVLKQILTRFSSDRTPVEPMLLFPEFSPGATLAKATVK